MQQQKLSVLESATDEEFSELDTAMLVELKEVLLEVDSGDDHARVSEVTAMWLMEDGERLRRLSGLALRCLGREVEFKVVFYESQGLSRSDRDEWRVVF